MDGEVYDYEAEKQFLLNKGHRFKYRNNDAEYCLHLYEELGEESFKNLNGSFLIAIYDPRINELILVNDRFSSYPLFFYAEGGDLIFGAQLKAIIQSQRVPKNLNMTAIMEYFTFNQVLGTKTYYKNIKVMSPASILRFKDGSINYKHYWEMNYQEEIRRTQDYYIDALADAIKKAVGRKTGDKHNYGILLSGGLDSRGVLAASECAFDAYTIGCEKNYEAKIAEKVAKLKGCSFTFLKLGLDHYANIAEKSVELSDGMSSFQHGHFIGFLDSIRKRSDVLFTGHAFDILFTGYYLPYKRIQIFNKTILIPELFPLADETMYKVIMNRLYQSNWSKRPGSLFKNDLSSKFNEVLEKSVRAILTDSKDHATDLYNQFDYFVYHFPFKHYSYLNLMCIQHYMEQRIIAFDNDLFDLYLEMPPRYRFEGRIYRKALQRINPDFMKVPDAKNALSPMVGKYAEITITTMRRFIKKLSKPQQSNPSYTQHSWLNMPELVRHNNKLKLLIWNVINDETYINSNIFDRSTLIEMFNNHINRRGDFTNQLFAILTFGIWYKKYGPH
jgi:asparagine synthase (glutamine-hydrolysing)